MLPFIIAGLATGAVYGLVGVGLVLTYKTSGVFNFAHGALATVAAYAFYFLYVQHHVPLTVSIIVSVLILGPALGFGFERLAMNASRVPLAMQIVMTVGVLLGVESLASILWGPNTRPFPSFLPTGELTIGGVRIGADQITVFGISAAAAAALYFFLRTARLGKAMRAVVDNPDLLSLQGTSPVAVRRWAWVIGCTFATLSGLLLAPSVDLNAESLTLLIIQAFGAAAIGGFSSLPLTWAGGLVIGIAASLVTKYVSTTNLILGGLAPGIPFIVLFLVVLFFPAERLRRVPATSAAAAQAVAARAASPWSAPPLLQAAGGAALLAFLIFVPSFVGFQLTGWTLALADVILLLSLGLLVKTSGQVSLCQMTFAAIGAVTFSRLAVNVGVPWIPALILAGLAAVPVGALLAIPAVRLSGLYLALATFGFGLLVQNMFYNSNLMFGASSAGIPEPVPSLSWLDVSSTTGFYYVVLAITVLASAVVVTLTHGRLGRLLRGLSNSPTALTTSGTSVTVTRVLVFCISAFIAAIAGALLGMTNTIVTGGSYDPLMSLTFVALIVITVGSAPWYAWLAGAGVGLVPVYLTGSNVTYYLQLLFGVAAIAVAVGGTAGLPVSWRAALDRLGRRRRPTTTAVTAATGEHTPDRVPPMGLEVCQLRVSFGGLHAVDGLDLVALAGQITGLIGPNGAGKTTTFNACSGLNRAVGGRVMFGGEDVTRVGPAGRARRGLGRTFQQMELYESMTVAQNVALGREAALAGVNAATHVLSRAADRREIGRRAAEAIDLCGLRDIAGHTVAGLSTGQRRLVELARCLAGRYSFLLLDEPSSGLDRAETARFGEILSRVVAERGVGILLVEHDMALVMDICADIYVLDFGRLLFHGTPDEVRGSEAVQAAYLGSEVGVEPAS